jgi:hypothetical protein
MMGTKALARARPGIGGRLDTCRLAQRSRCSSGDDRLVAFPALVTAAERYGERLHGNRGRRRWRFVVVVAAAVHEQCIHAWHQRVGVTVVIARGAAFTLK